MPIHHKCSQSQDNASISFSVAARLNRSKVIHSPFISKLCQLALVVVVPLAFNYGTATSAKAATLWYNGDPDGQGSTPNQTFWVRDRSLRRVSLNDFTVPTTDGGWEINTIWSNNLIYPGSNFSQASWEILTVIPPQRPGEPYTYGSFLASNLSPATITPTNFQVSGQPVVRVSVSGLNIRLTPGTYWLVVAPFFDEEDSYPQPLEPSRPPARLATTSGANAIGTPAGNNGNSFTGAYSFYYFPDSRDYSMAIEGEVVPEPTSILSLLTFGALTLGFQRCCKQRLTPDANSRGTNSD